MKINLPPLFRVRKKQKWLIPVRIAVVCCLAILSTFACSDKNRQQPEPVEQTWDFVSGDDGWKGDFAEYPSGEEELYELLFERDTLPLPLDQDQLSLKFSGNNLNSDLFMFAKKRITGLVPNTVYFVTFTVEFASNLPGDSTIQESPGKLVYLAAGATLEEPHKISGENNIFGMNIGKCNLDQNGENMVVLGDFTNGSDQPVYVLKNLENENPFRCVSGENGEVWVVIGIDSAYPHTNTVYLNTIKVKFF